ncbi:hypothetical protein SteCoe_15893 [Stentor coeruleus]|uniref:Arrestin-like N-terminal domain-containing protein n=1 Tax=Stentor coeruleus TaxID=5963 RepID=A0A1R2C2Q7_9CILI|nr:hypothetical protein SteCoe_15893 [Stentor coeruleus]
MGTSTSSIGNIYVELAKQSFIVGENIQGKVHVSIQNDMPPGFLDFQFSGKERLLWAEEGLSQASLSYTTNKKRSICKVRYELFTWDKVLECGDYTIPFTFNVPDSIPGSFFFEADTTKFVIYYSICVKLVSDQYKLRSKNKVIIFAKKLNIERNVVVEKDVGFSGCFCKKKGFVKLKSVMSQDTYRPTEVLECSLDIDNSKGKTSIKKIISSILYVIRINIPGHAGIYHQECIYEQEQSVNVGPGGLIAGPYAAKIQIDISKIKQYLLRINSLDTEITQSSYFLDLKLVSEGLFTCGGESPRISMLIYLYPDGDVPIKAIEPPKNWKPKVLSPIKIDYSSCFEVPSKLDQETEQLNITTQQNDLAVKSIDH